MRLPLRWRLRGWIARRSRLQEDLDLVLGDLDPQLLVAVDMRGAVIVALDADVAVGVQLGVLPLPARRIPACGSGLSAAFSSVSKRSRRETPKRVWRRSLMRSMHSLERLVDLR